MGTEIEPKKRIFLHPNNPLLTARLFLETLRTPDGEDTLKYHTGNFLPWEGISFRIAEEIEIRGKLYRFMEESFVHAAAGSREEQEQPFCPTKQKVDQVMDALRAECFVRNTVAMPYWLDGRKADPRECLPCKNGIVHLPTFTEGRRQYIEPPTPLYFSTCCLPFDFRAESPSASCWLAFLDQVFGGDAEAIRCLQQWFGYCLTPDTRYQKMFLLYGPPRSGKGTIARILTAPLGAMNVANPTLSSLTTSNFGLWPLIGKTLAIIGDARLSGRTDLAVVNERLLSISGEDSLTIDRKNREPVTVRLFCRILFLTNELPRLGDASGALPSRFIILRLRQSFLGREDMALEQKLLAELPSILHWAIEGWLDLRSQGRFIEPASSIAEVRELEELSSPIKAFIRERCTIAPGRTVETSELFAEWQNWCTSQGRDHSGTVQDFGKNLGAAFPELKDRRPTICGVRVRVYEGIGIGVDNTGGAL